MSKHIGFYHKCDICGKERRNPMFVEWYECDASYCSCWYKYGGKDVCFSCRDKIDTMSRVKDMEQKKKTVIDKNKNK